MSSVDQRTLMLQMADHWDKLAEDRIALIEKHPELAHAGEHEETQAWNANRPLPEV